MLVNRRRIIGRVCTYPLRRQFIYQFDQIVNARDLDAFKIIIERKRQSSIDEVFKEWINITAFRTLFLVENNEKFNFLNYLIDLPSFDVNYLDIVGRNCLMHLPLTYFNESFIRILISRGADIHLRDKNGNTILHIAAMDSFTSNCAQAAKFFIGEGLDVNAENDEGKTPFYIACERGFTDWSYLFLEYRANPNIPCFRNILPMTLIPQSSNESPNEELQNLLFDYIFDSTNSSIGLLSIAKSMVLSTSFFQKICNQVSYVSYEISDFEEFCCNLKHARAANLKMFVEKFGFIMKELVDYCPVLKLILQFGLSFVMSELKEILDVFVYSSHISDLVGNHDPLYPTISCLIKIFNSDEIMFVEEEEITKIACLLLEHGLGVTITDLDTVYKYYGYGELFKILLHMDLVTDSEEINVQVEQMYIDERNRIQRSGMVELLLDPTRQVDDCMDDPFSFFEMLHFFNHTKLKEMCLQESNNVEVLEKVKSLPQVPFLTELSRNVARKFIVDRFKITSCSRFYTILKWLPIGETNRRILALEDILY